ncbi:hypothetical protein O4H49_06195 [Kiloniella laminariae]|uniref:Lipoprotein n=1 Tax=Kiloniella laminariae TaxID=454162 RepID=A0ABT4LGX4_9PROT|nr:hypothetical protein [Kiloniella laminariae]MCZ4280358.1 hypothetical protein [Kiloniella laminariae]
MRRFSVAAALAFTLSGCALPPAIGVASIAVDVASYFFSGKTLTDHGISAVAQQDCALIRIMEGDLCDEYSDFETAEVTLEPLSPVDEVEIAAVSDFETSISYFAEDAQKGAVDPAVSSSYAQDIEEIGSKTDHLYQEQIISDAFAVELFGGADYLADRVQPLSFSK